MNEFRNDIYVEYENNIPNYENDELEPYNKTFIWAQQMSLEENDNDNLYEQKFHQNDFSLKNYFIKEVEEINNNIEHKKTQATTLTQKIIDKDKCEEKNIYSFKPEQNNENHENNNNIYIEKKTKRQNNNKGRYKKNEFSDNSNKHGKDAEDNLMRKIKTFIFSNILSTLNRSLKDKSILFIKLEKKLNENLKKDFNEDLMQKTIKEIFLNFDISKRFKKEAQNFPNKNLIKKLYEEGKEKDTINILNMKYIDVIKNIRENNMEKFLHKIQLKENKNNGMNDEEYLKLLKDIFNRYEEWFKGKKGRNRTN